MLQFLLVLQAILLVMELMDFMLPFRFLRNLVTPRAIFQPDAQWQTKFWFMQPLTLVHHLLLLVFPSVFIVILLMLNSNISQLLLVPQENFIKEPLAPQQVVDIYFQLLLLVSVYTSTVKCKHVCHPQQHRPRHQQQDQVAALQPLKEILDRSISPFYLWS